MSPTTKKTLTSAIIATLCVFVFAFPAAAECVTVRPNPNDPPPDAAVADFLFAGKVTALDYEPGLAKLTLDVDRVWAGAVHRRTTLFLVRGEDSITVDYFRVGTSYLITLYFGYQVTEEDARNGIGPAGAISAILTCQMPPKVSEARRQIKRLGRPKNPLP